MEIPVFKIRASASGQIMAGRIGLTEKQTQRLSELSVKSPLTAKQCEEMEELIFKRDNIELSETSKTYCKEWLTEKIYGYRKEIKSKYLDKGSIMEDDAISNVIQWLDIPFVMKNETYFEDEYFTGSPDIIIDELDRVDDTKCSWDCFTFPLFEKEIPNTDYFYQLQIYMHLTGKNHASLDYCLMDTPTYLDYGEPKTYSHLDTNLRVKTFQFDYDENVIKDLKKRVDLCREYIDGLLKQLNQ